MEKFEIRFLEMDEEGSIIATHDVSDGYNTIDEAVEALKNLEFDDASDLVKVTYWKDEDGRWSIMDAYRDCADGKSYYTTGRYWSEA